MKEQETKTRKIFSIFYKRDRQIDWWKERERARKKWEPKKVIQKTCNMNETGKIQWTEKWNKFKTIESIFTDSSAHIPIRFDGQSNRDSNQVLFLRYVSFEWLWLHNSQYLILHLMAEKTHDLIENKMILNLTENEQEKKEKENMIKIASFQEHISWIGGLFVNVFLWLWCSCSNENEQSAFNLWWNIVHFLLIQNNSNSQLNQEKWIVLCALCASKGKKRAIQYIRFFKD